MSEHHILSATIILTLVAFVGFGIHAVVRPRDYSFVADRGKWDEMRVRLVMLIFTTCGSAFMLYRFLRAIGIKGHQDGSTFCGESAQSGKLHRFWLLTDRPQTTPIRNRYTSLMIPVGYMAKRLAQRAEWLKSPAVLDVYSVGDCVNDAFADYVDYWKYNGWWFFDSPEAIRAVSQEHAIDLDDTLLFYYEVYEFEFHDGEWRLFSPWKDSWNSSNIIVSSDKRLDGYDVVTFWPENSPAPGHSPL